MKETVCIAFNLAMAAATIFFLVEGLMWQYKFLAALLRYKKSLRGRDQVAAYLAGMQYYNVLRDGKVGEAEMDAIARDVDAMHDQGGQKKEAAFFVDINTMKRVVN